MSLLKTDRLCGGLTITMFLALISAGCFDYPTGGEASTDSDLPTYVDVPTDSGTECGSDSCEPECDGCLMDGDQRCYSHDDPQPDNPCFTCDATTKDWVIAQQGADCPDDGLFCTDDVCDADANCTHPPITTCLAGCDEDNNECCTPNHTLGCHSHGIYNYDSCGNLGILVTQCDFADQVCDEISHTCIPAPYCGDLEIDEGEACDHGSYNGSGPGKCLDDCSGVEMCAPPCFACTGVSGSGTLQTGGNWALDRIDQRDQPLNNQFRAAGTGLGVNVYLFSAGIRYSHLEFGGRAKPFYDYEGADGEDCIGNGTHMAGLIGGANYGVAKQATIHNVRVLNCDGTTAGDEDLINALDYVRENHEPPAIAVLGFGGSSFSAELDLKVKSLVAAGITVVATAGAYSDACEQWPSKLNEVITVGTTDNTDTATDFTNRGECVDLFAPGQNVTSAWHTCNNCTSTISSMGAAAALTAGVIAANYATGCESPAHIKGSLLNDATANILGNIGTGSPNLLLYAK